MKQGKVFVFIFLGILTLDLVCKNFDQLVGFRIITKPSVITSLLIFYYLNSFDQDKNIRNPMLTALIFLILGDISFLYFDNPAFFNIGLAMFMMANFFYFRAFLLNTDFNMKLLVPFWIMCFTYFFIMVTLMYDNLGTFFIPLLVFFIIMISMAHASYMRYGIVNNKSFVLVLLGALLFLFSISIIGLSRFYKPIPFQNTLEMLSYGIGQLLIVFGILVEKRVSNPKFPLF